MIPIPRRLRLTTVLLSLAAIFLSGCGRSRTPPAEDVPAISPAPTPPAPSTSPGTAQTDLPPSDSAGADRNLPFREITLVTGIDFRFHSGRDAEEYAILESLGGGVGVFDFDRDGRVDLMFAGGGDLHNRTITPHACGLYRNLGDYQFVEQTQLAGAAADRFYTHGVYPADFNGDGFTDVIVSGYGGLQLLKNQGDGTLKSIEPWAEATDQQWSTGVSWGDFNADGHLDLYVPHYVSWSWDEHPPCFAAEAGVREVCGPREFRGLNDTLLLSDTRGGFIDTTDTAGLVDGGKGLGSVALDVDLDGDTDVYVANDTTDNFLYINDGQGVFTESAIIGGVSGDDVGVNTGSMGIAAGDCNADGLPDLWVTNFERELFALYRNESAGSFTHTSRPAGLAALGGLYVGFGTVFVDFDHDADQDLVVANGHVSYHSQHSPYLQQGLLLENTGRGKFQRLPSEGYFAESHSGRGLAAADLNNDGGWDMIFCNSEEPVSILAARPPADAAWAVVELVGKQTNRDAIGATVQLVTKDRRQAFPRLGGGSYLSSSDPRFLLVLPKHATEAEVQVTWNSQHTETFPFPTQTRHVLWVEGSSTAPQAD
ncbi:CRTAC1 family protein [Roseimaritima ulvae]|uniref:FG-GAP repeat protein n=1 Tax=Roseimaritima ulvae TaxID=980254 RepID=A0A5B9QGR0_9BACT|nr:CRTAC1 family protein [Roseimaritima ulvae]QEG38228.1 FG-GAP repeat protein [Roseimaritima ulvae]